MRILIVNRAMGTLIGGGEIFDSRAAYYLGEKGHNVQVLTACQRGEEIVQPLPGIRMAFVQSPNLRRWAYRTEKWPAKISAAFYYLDLYLFERAVMQWLAHNERYREFDVVQVCGLFGLANKLIQQWDVPTVAWLPGIPSGKTRQWIRQLNGNPRFRLFSRGDPVRFVANEMGLGTQAIETIEPGLELERIRQLPASSDTVRQQWGISEGAPLGITVARLVPVKDVEFLLRGLACAVRQVPGLHHLIVGSGPLQNSLENKCRALGLEKQVHFLGHRPPDMVHELLAASDYFALTSKYENFSNAALEAMCHGLPVIGTAVGYLQELIRQSEAGLVVESGDDEALGREIVRICENRVLRETLGKRGGNFVKELDWPVIAAKLECLYESVIKSDCRS